jgi:GAF domain-containing protein
MKGLTTGFELSSEQVEMLELAAVQAGLALENELLRRQVGQTRPEPSPTSHT